MTQVSQSSGSCLQWIMPWGRYRKHASRDADELVKVHNSLCRLMGLWSAQSCLTPEAIKCMKLAMHGQHGICAPRLFKGM